MRNKYLAVFGALAALTAVTVSASYLHLARAEAIALALLIAFVKVSLIVAIFMHMKFEGKIIRVIFLAALFFVLVLLFFVMPDLGWSCPVCFGESGGNLAKGFTWGILVLLVLPAAVFGTIAFKIVMSVRRKNEISRIAGSPFNPNSPAL